MAAIDLLNHYSLVALKIGLQGAECMKGKCKYVVVGWDPSESILRFGIMPKCRPVPGVQCLRADAEYCDLHVNVMREILIR
jgi:hypothetical protein